MTTMYKAGADTVVAYKIISTILGLSVTVRLTECLTKTPPASLRLALGGVLLGFFLYDYRN